VFPSRLNPNYILARRRQYSAGMGDVAILDNKHPDTNFMIGAGLLPVASLNFSGTWTMTPFEQLRQRDTWGITGGHTATQSDPEAALNKLVQHVEDVEAAQQRRERVTLRDQFYHMARDAYRSMAARTGRRNKRASDYHGHAQPTSGGTAQ
jgi:hypothetical protein